jgi:riboflavin synthase
VVLCSPVVFTGLVQTQGRLLARNPRGRGFRLSLAHDFGPIELGESIAVNGVCLTATACHPDRFEADASRETVSSSNLGALPIGCSVHLERALRVGDRFGGHIVAGHVDNVTRLLESTNVGDSLELVFELPNSLLPFIAEKGSVALDGVSLTVNRVTEAGFGVTVVPHTERATHLAALRQGDEVNVEVDVLARYIVHLARIGAPAAGEPNRDTPDRDASLRQALRNAGIL